MSLLTELPETLCQRTRGHLRLGIGGTVYRVSAVCYQQLTLNPQPPQRKLASKLFTQWELGKTGELNAT
jgi:hypothetical protein